MTTNVYKVVSDDNLFAAFWRSSEETISFFIPSSYEIYSTESPNELSKTFSASFTIEGSSDERFLSIAENYLNQKGIYVDKRNISISTIEPGVYYPRIWRGHSTENDPFVGYRALNPSKEYGSKHIQSVTAASSLFDYLYPSHFKSWDLSGLCSSNNSKIIR